ncbi:MAG: hypothetical protein ACNA8K_03565 [Cyclonatronaceae bacterium]
MDLFKLLFEHDMLLDEGGSSPAGQVATLEEFLRPQPAFSRFYFSGTVLEERLFGLDQLQHFNEVIQGIDQALGKPVYDLKGGQQMRGLLKVLEASSVFDAFVITSGSQIPPVDDLQLDIQTGVQQKLPLLRSLLGAGHIILFIEKTDNGSDLHLFSRDNIYPALFGELKPLVGPDFRFFSINGKRAKSDRLFFFETWTLDRPPHGFEEVFPETVL